MERKGFIGGSDMYSIVRGDWNTLWHVKTGRTEPEDLSNQFNVALGVETEEFNLNWLHQQTGWYGLKPELKSKVIFIRLNEHKTGSKHLNALFPRHPIHLFQYI